MPTSSISDQQQANTELETSDEDAVEQATLETLHFFRPWESDFPEELTAA